MNRRGFTIVELLIVIVVIAILAALSIATYTGMQQRARQSKINQDLALFDKAIQAARINSGQVALRYITGSTATAGVCVTQADGTDLSSATAAATCWTGYTNMLEAISTASNINIRNLVDPWGRPYFLDENEQEGVNVPCGAGRDRIGVYLLPHVQNNWSVTNSKNIPYVTPGC